MSYWEVKESLDQLVDISEYDTERILTLCRVSLDEIAAKLKAKTDVDDARVTSAAAATAYYKLLLRESYALSDSGITSFKAGDISVTQSMSDITKQLEKAEKYRESKLAEIIPLCDDHSFAFTQVKIKVKP